MIRISKEAEQQLKEYKERRGADSSVRIGIVSGNSSGSMLGISIDEEKNSDTRFSYDGFELIVDTQLLQFCEEIEVEFILKQEAGCGSGGLKITPKVNI